MKEKILELVKQTEEIVGKKIISAKLQVVRDRKPNLLMVTEDCVIIELPVTFVSEEEIYHALKASPKDNELKWLLTRQNIIAEIPVYDKLEEVHSQESCKEPVGIIAPEACPAVFFTAESIKVPFKETPITLSKNESEPTNEKTMNDLKTIATSVTSTIKTFDNLGIVVTSVRLLSDTSKLVIIVLELLDGTIVPTDLGNYRNTTVTLRRLLRDKFDTNHIEAEIKF